MTHGSAKEGVVRPLPGINTENKRYWESSHRHSLEMPKCNACGEVFYPLTNRCRRCLSDSLIWIPISGDGQLVTWNVMHQIYDPAFRDLVPYIVAVVKLVEGPQMISNIVQSEPNELSIDMPLRLRYVDIENVMSIPVFVPAKAVYDVT